MEVSDFDFLFDDDYEEDENECAVCGVQIEGGEALCDDCLFEEDNDETDLVERWG